jgi:hypothetical protein
MVGELIATLASSSAPEWVIGAAVGARSCRERRELTKNSSGRSVRNRVGGISQTWSPRTGTS